MGSFLQFGSLLAAGLSTIGATPEQPTLLPEPTPVVRTLNDEFSRASFSSELQQLTQNANMQRREVTAPSESLSQKLVPDLTAAQVKQYILSVDRSLSNVIYLPEQALQHPAIANKIRHAINEQLRPGGPSLRSNELVEILCSSAVYHIPDLLELLQVTPAEQIPAIPASWVLVNPRTIEYAWKQGHLPSQWAQRALLDVQRALDSLGIQEFRRFDNARELICNRYSIATPMERYELEKSMGSGYFIGVDERAQIDTRPIAVVIQTTKDGDYNGAFREYSNSYSDTRREAIDYLTSGYRVFYFECDRDRDAFSALAQVFNLTGKQIELVLFGGHGSQDAIGLGGDFPDVAIDIGDGPILSEFTHAIKPGAQIILNSCSTGSNEAGKTSIAEVISKAWPGVNVYAPDAPTNSHLEFNADGSFAKINYTMAGLVHFKPDGTVSREGYLPSKSGMIKQAFSDFGYEYYKDLRNISPTSILKWCITTVVAGLFLGGMIDLSKKLIRLVRRKHRPEPAVINLDQERKRRRAA